MKPGRELDALVAEKVMGCKLAYQALSELHTGRIINPKEITYCGCKESPHGNDGSGLNDFDAGPPSLYRYSTDIKAAWDVIIQVWKKTGKWILVAPNYDGSKWQAYHSTECADPDWGDFYEVSDKSPEHAICRAGLKAVGVEI